MSRVLISITELADTVRALPTIDVDGERHYDGPRLLEAIAALTGTAHPALWDSPARITDKTALVEMLDLSHTNEHANDPGYDPRFADTPEEAAERARLAALPPGQCVCAPPGAPAHEHVHPGEMCEDCGCEDYVDTTQRDPRQARIDAGGEMPPLVVQPLPHIDPEMTMDRHGDKRPAANANAFRPPSGPTNVLPGEDLDGL